MYLAVKGSKSANQFIGHVLSDEWDPYSFVKESGITNQPKEKEVEKDGFGLKEGRLIKSTVDKASKNHPWYLSSGSKDDANDIQDEKDVPVEVPNAANEEECKDIAVNVGKKCVVSEAKE